MLKLVALQRCFEVEGARTRSQDRASDGNLMDFTELESDFGAGTAEFRYLKECVERIALEVGEELSDIEAMALMQVLQISTYECNDGFLINDIREDFSTFGRVNTAAIASALTKGRHDTDWFRQEYLSAPKETAGFEMLWHEIEHKLTQSGRLRLKDPRLH